MSSNAKRLTGYICAILSAVIYGCMPLMAKYIYAEGVTPMTLVLLRNALALPSLALPALLQKKPLKRPARQILPLGIPALFGCVLTPVLLFSSYTYIASGTATVFHFVYPCLVLLIGFVFLRKKPAIGTAHSSAYCSALAAWRCSMTPQRRFHRSVRHSHLARRWRLPFTWCCCRAFRPSNSRDLCSAFTSRYGAASSC